MWSRASPALGSGPIVRQRIILSRKWSARSGSGRRRNPGLLRDCAAGDAVAGVAGGIGFVIVGFGMDDDRRAAVAEQRLWAVAEIDVIVLKLGVGDASGVHLDISHVAGVMAFGIVESVLLAVGIEMRARGLEVWTIAFGILMKVDRVFAGREIMKVQLDDYTRSVWRQDDRAYGLAISVLHLDLGFSRARKSK